MFSEKEEETARNQSFTDFFPNVRIVRPVVAPMNVFLIIIMSPRSSGVSTWL
jgi:hypothetical protein